MKYIVKPRAARKIYTFYGNVAKKYRHTYDKADYKRNVSEALNYALQGGGRRSQLQTACDLQYIKEEQLDALQVVTGDR